jgi:hypothetical protein
MSNKTATEIQMEFERSQTILNVWTQKMLAQAFRESRITEMADDTLNYKKMPDWRRDERDWRRKLPSMAHVHIRRPPMFLMWAP